MLGQLQRYLGIAVVLVVSLVFAGAIQTYASQKDVLPEAATIGEGNPSMTVVTERFKKLAEEKGAVYAFDVLKHATMPEGIQVHLLGHEIGEVLYKEMGPNAIASCTSDFGNACSHAVAIGTISEYGTGAWPLIQKACAQLPGIGAYNICYHGVGHGVFAFYGYSLPDTIEICKRFGTKADNYREYRECLGGAIMELIGGGEHDTDKWRAAREKYFDPNDPLSPCASDVVPNDLKSMCLVYLTPRLLSLASGQSSATAHDPTIFTKAFSYCDALPKERVDLRSACYGGFGKEFDSFAGERDTRLLQEGLYTDDQLQTIDDWCALASSEDGHAWCVETAIASLFWGGEHDPALSFRFCSLIDTEKAQHTCYQSLSKAIAGHMRAGSVRNSLCLQLPVSYQPPCFAETVHKDMESFI